jgi:hypothetical protein
MILLSRSIVFYYCITCNIIIIIIIIIIIMNSHFSALFGKYSPILGFSNQQD